MKNQENYCVFCGIKSKTTQDHIPPQCLFPKPKPTDLITVPACDNCNNKSKLDDEYFLYFLHIGLDQNNDNNGFITDRINKLLKKKLFLDSIMRNLIYTPVYDNGIYIGKKKAFKFDRQRIQKIMDKIVIGLYYKNTNCILPKNIIISDFNNVSPYNFNPIEKHQLAMEYLPIKDIDDGKIFSYRYFINPKNNLESFWYFMFFNQLLFTLTTKEYSIFY